MKARFAAVFAAAFIAQTLFLWTAVQAATGSADTGSEPAIEVESVGTDAEPAVEAESAADTGAEPIESESSTVTIAQGTVTVTGRASVYSVPDKAILTLRVQTTEDTAEKAQSQNSIASNTVVDALKKEGIDEKSIRTTDYSLYPQYDYSQYGDDSESKITGYTCNSQIEIKDLDADHVGQIISAAVSAGANGIDSIEFKCSDYDARYDEALEAALKAARHTAEVLAAAAGQTVGTAVSIEEGYHSTDSQYRSMDYMDTAASEDAETGDSFVFTPGESEIEASVTVTYSIS